MNLKSAAPEKFGPVRSFFYRLWAEPSIAPMHRRIAAEVPIERGRLLDVGCGPGKLDRMIARARPEISVVGVDSSEPMIRAARKRPGPPNLEFHCGTVEKSGWTGEFDFALSVLSFHHWDEPEETLAAVHRALAPGGRFWIYEMEPDAPAGAIRADRAPLLGFFSIPMSMQRRMARDHGFTIAEVDAVVRPAVGRTPFEGLTVTRAGSTLRLELERRT
jgi:SAM-dependent methyltransferase